MKCPVLVGIGHHRFVVDGDTVFLAGGQNFVQSSHGDVAHQHEFSVVFFAAVRFIDFLETVTVGDIAY